MTKGTVQSTEPKTDSVSKRVMLRAERGDTVDIEDAGEMEVVQRLETYYGPKLRLCDEDDDDRQYLLIAPGFASNLELWRLIVNEDGFSDGWECLGEVSAEIVDSKQYDICPRCGEPLKTLDHERRSAVGACGK